MGRMAELYKELCIREDAYVADPMAELHHEITDALRRVVNGTATRDDARVLAYASGVSLSDIGIASVPALPDSYFDSKVF